MKMDISYEQLKASITKQEREDASKLAKSKGMTFQGWLGQLIKRELREAEKEGAYDRTV